MLKRALKFFLGMVLFPICIAVSVNLYQQLSQIKAISYSQKYFLFGVISYFIVHAIFFKPEYLYILGHEFMHAIAARIFRGRVTSFKVSPKGGQVTTTRSNLFIALAPYFFPFYTIIVVVIFSVIPLIIKTSPPQPLFLFLIGFTLTFHIVLTIDFLKIKQTDFLQGGYLFSICLVYLVNLVVIGFVFSLLFEEINFLEFLKSVYFHSKDIYVTVFRQLFL